MVKAYLRYEAAGTFGVVASSAAPEFSSDGKQLYTPALENVGVWNVKQGTLVRGCSTAAVRPCHATSLAAAMQLALARLSSGDARPCHRCSTGRPMAIAAELQLAQEPACSGADACLRCTLCLCVFTGVEPHAVCAVHL